MTPDRRHTRRGLGRSWSMAVGILIILVGITATVAGLSAAAGAQGPSPALDTNATQNGAGGNANAGDIVATGPFGSVPGISLAAGSSLPDPATLDALDAYGRGAKVILTPDEGSFDTWRVTAARETPAGPETAEALATGGSDRSASFRLPASGLFLVRLDATVVDPVTATPGMAGSWIWRIAVPDRDVPDGGDPYPPAPAIRLASADQSVDLDPGSGCFIGTCGDIGATSPPQTLPTIRTIGATALSVRLSDGSGVAAWSADATPIGDTDAHTIPLGSGAGATSTNQAWFSAPPRGRWVILVHVRFDRDRGTADGYGRLILE